MLEIINKFNLDKKYALFVQFLIYNNRYNKQVTSNNEMPKLVVNNFMNIFRYFNWKLTSLENLY